MRWAASHRGALRPPPFTRPSWGSCLLQWPAPPKKKLGKGKQNPLVFGHLMQERVSDVFFWKDPALERLLRMDCCSSCMQTARLLPSLANEKKGDGGGRTWCQVSLFCMVLLKASKSSHAKPRLKVKRSCCLVLSSWFSSSKRS